MAIAERLTKVHFSSESVGDALIHFANWRDGSRHAQRPGHVHIRVKSISDFLMALGRLRHSGLAEMDFHSHGGPGWVEVGHEELSAFALGPFRPQGLETIFAPQARITLLGCYVAYGAKGELFLAELGAIFLKVGGGTVKAATDGGEAHPFTSGNVDHADGKWVYAHVVPGGAVTLQNHTWLDAVKIRRAIQRDVDFLNQLQQARPWANGLGQPARQKLQAATTLLGPPGSRPAYPVLYRAFADFETAHHQVEHLRQANRQVGQPVGGH
jgi:hypothetical protein